MKRLILAVVVVAALAPTVLRAEEGKFMVTLRGDYLKPADKSDAIPSLSVAADAITVSTKVIPDLNFSYFFTPSLAANLVLTIPQEHEVELNDTKIGTFKHLPPTLTLQYHFLPEGMVRPYVGAGVNLTLISSVDLNVPNVGALDLESSSVGYAVGAGVDIKVGEKLFLNLDAKYVNITSDVTLKANDTKVSAVEVNPLLLGGGIGIRF